MKACEGPLQEGGTGAYYCPADPWTEAWDCDKCRDEREAFNELLEDMKRDEDDTEGTRWP
jgi:hypothetical protein